MSAYFALLLFGLWLGVIDWLLKGREMKRKGWFAISLFKRGYWWPVMFFGIWVVVVGAFVNHFSAWYWFGLLGFINEDFGYYLCKRWAYKNVPEYSYWPKWLGLWKSEASYNWTVIIVNLILLAIMLSIGV